MNCWLICFSQHYAIIKWTYSDLLALPGVLSYIFSRKLFIGSLKPDTRDVHIQVCFSPLIKHNDIALFLVECHLNKKKET